MLSLERSVVVVLGAGTPASVEVVLYHTTWLTWPGTSSNSAWSGGKSSWCQSGTFLQDSCEPITFIQMNWFWSAANEWYNAAWFFSSLRYTYISSRLSIVKVNLTVSKWFIYWFASTKFKQLHKQQYTGDVLRDKRNNSHLQEGKAQSYKLTDSFWYWSCNFKHQKPLTCLIDYIFGEPYFCLKAEIKGLLLILNCNFSKLFRLQYLIYFSEVWITYAAKELLAEANLHWNSAPTLKT